MALRLHVEVPIEREMLSVEEVRLRRSERSWRDATSRPLTASRWDWNSSSSHTAVTSPNARASSAVNLSTQRRRPRTRAAPTIASGSRHAHVTGETTGQERHGESARASGSRMSHAKASPRPALGLRRLIAAIVTAGSSRRSIGRGRAGGRSARPPPTELGLQAAAMSDVGTRAGPVAGPAGTGRTRARRRGRGPSRAGDGAL